MPDRLSLSTEDWQFTDIICTLLTVYRCAVVWPGTTAQ